MMANDAMSFSCYSGNHMDCQRYYQDGNCCCECHESKEENQ